jgi:hypothetical protein
MRRVPRPIGWCAAAVVFGSAAVGLLAQPAAALPTPTFSLSPIVTPGAVHPRGSFSYTLRPGETINDDVVLANESSGMLDFELWSADAYNTYGGGFALRPISYDMIGVGSWVHLRLRQGIYALPPHSAVTIPFSLTVPANATPGDHAGGIVALNVRGASPAVPTHVNIQPGAADAVFVRVAGPVASAAAISSISVRSSDPLLAFLTGSSSAVVSAQVENTGNTILTGKVEVRVTDIFGRTVKSFSAVPVAKFIPGQRFTITEPIWKSLPIVGPETVHVQFVSSQLSRPATGDSTFWVIPWLLVAVVVLVLAGAGWYWRHRRRTKQQGPEPAPQPPAEEPVVTTGV